MKYIKIKIGGKNSIILNVAFIESIYELDEGDYDEVISEKYKSSIKMRSGEVLYTERTLSELETYLH